MANYSGGVGRSAGLPPQAVVLQRVADARVLLVGQAPSRGSDGLPAFCGRSGAFLARLVGLPRADFLRRVEAVNLLPAWPGRFGRGDLFPAASAADAARMLQVASRRVLLAGSGVAAAFGLRVPPWLSRASLGRGEEAAWAVPHPSGVVRW